MNTLKLLPYLTLLASCTGTGKNHEKITSDISTNSKVDTSTASINHVDSSRMNAMQFAEGIIGGQIDPSDNDQTFAWLDSLQSVSKPTRDVAFKVYRAMSLKSDGALSEAICGHIKSYLKVHPSEFLENYTILNENQRRKTIENISFEFYASGMDYKKDIDEYFAVIATKCQPCFSNPTLQEIKSAIEKQVSKMNE
jgi:hypothetical protein